MNNLKKYFSLFFLILFTACNSEQAKNEENTSQVETDEVKEKIQEQSFISLGDEPQYVEIIGDSPDNPVLLFLHGGPGWPQTPYLKHFNAELAKKYTLVIWEQRGAGQSFVKNSNPENVSLEQLIADGLELTKLLKEKFNQEKIYLAGYSWGSVLGMHLAKDYPENYLAYIGIAQIINYRDGKDTSRAWLREQAEAKNDQAALSTLDSLAQEGICEDEQACFMKQYELINKYNGALYNTEIIPELDKAIDSQAAYKDYDWMAAYNFSIAQLRKDLYITDFNDIKKLELPVFLMQGRHDWNVPSVLAEQWLNQLEAPQKNIFWFENSAHALMEEEAQKFSESMNSLVERLGS